MGAEPSERLEGKVPHGWLPISHVESILAIPSLELIGLCDNDTTRLTRLSKLYNITNSYTDYTKLIDELKPQFLSIATRTKGRSDIIKYACENGVKILYFEKPICNSIEETKQCLNVIKNNNVIFGYGVNRRYHETYRKAKEIIYSGEIGEIKHISIEHGIGSLYWAHPHSVDIILFFSNTCDLEYIQGSCKYTNAYNPTNIFFIDDDPIVEHAFFKFKNGITANISPIGGLNTRIYCSKGVLTIYSDGSRLEINDSPDSGYLKNAYNINIDIKKSSTMNIFTELIDLYSSDIINIPITINEVLTGMVMLTGIVFSSENDGRKIKPDNVPENIFVTGKFGNVFA